MISIALAMSQLVRSSIPQGMVDKPESPAARFNFVSENEAGERAGWRGGGARGAPVMREEKERAKGEEALGESKGELESELARKGISHRGWMLISIFQLRRRRRRNLAPSAGR